MIARTSSVDVARVLAAEVSRADGTRARLAELGRDAELGRAAPLLLVYVRHFACPGCSHFMESLAPRLPELAALGVRVVLVGSGSVARLVAFAERMKLRPPDVELVTDPSLEAYAAAGMHRSAMGTYAPKPVLASLGLYALGHWVKRHADDGDVEQQGGVLLLDADRRVVAHHEDRDLVDHAPMADVVHVALELAAARATASA